MLTRQKVMCAQQFPAFVVDCIRANATNSRRPSPLATRHSLTLLSFRLSSAINLDNVHNLAFYNASMLLNK